MSLTLLCLKARMLQRPTFMPKNTKLSGLGPEILNPGTRVTELNPFTEPARFSPDKGQAMSKWWRAVAAAGTGIRSATEAPSRRSYFTIQAIPREVTGNRISARDRAQGRIPAVVFSQNYVQTKPSDPTSIAATTAVSRKRLLTTERKQIKSILKSVESPFFCSTTFPFQIRAGSGSSTLLESGKVLPIKASNIRIIMNNVFMQKGPLFFFFFFSGNVDS